MIVTEIRFVKFTREGGVLRRGGLACLDLGCVVLRAVRRLSLGWRGDYIWLVVFAAAAATADEVVPAFPAAAVPL